MLDERLILELRSAEMLTVCCGANNCGGGAAAGPNLPPALKSSTSMYSTFGSLTRSDFSLTNKVVAVT